MTLDPALDYRYGWRWLLPIGDRDRVALYGFGEQEAAFWKQQEGIAIVESMEEATFLVAEDLPPPGHGACPGLEGFAVTGTSGQVREWSEWALGRFPVVRRYALLEPVRPRLVISLARPRFTREGLALHRPGRPVARYLVGALGYLAGLGIRRPLERRVLLVASRESRPPRGAVDAGIPLAARQDCTLYLGTPDENRKTVALVHGDEPILVKSGQSPQARAALYNEAQVLRVLAETPLAPHVPRLLDFVEREDQVSLHQQYRRRVRAASARIESAVVDFLARLSHVERSERPLAEVLTDEDIAQGMDWCRTRGVATGLLDRLEALARKGATVAGHRSHGDFAPWNCAWTKNGLWVFDWEASRPWDLALADAFYYRLAPVLHIHGEGANPRAVRNAALALHARVAARAGLSRKEGERDWAFWLLRQMGENPAELYRQLLQELQAAWKSQPA